MTLIDNCRACPEGVIVIPDGADVARTGRDNRGQILGFRGETVADCPARTVVVLGNR